MEATLPKSHEIQTKLLTKSKYVPENLSMKLLCDIIFCRSLASPTFLVLK